MKKILVIYNTCGISGKENYRQYIDSLESILYQKFDSFDIVLSDCLSSSKTRKYVQSALGSSINYNFIDTKIPVNVSSNHTARVVSRAFGNYEGYLYVDSGVDLWLDKYILEKMYGRLASNKYSLIAGRVDTDLVNYFTVPTKEDYIVPLGKAINLHLQLFSNLWFSSYDGLMPDIFAGHCSESVLSFMAAAINTKWILCGDVLATHKLDIDMQSAGFKPIDNLSSGYPTWNHPFVIDRESFLSRLCSDKAKDLGLGYEEVREISKHNTTAFDDNDMAVSNGLKDYIKDNLFLNKNEFDYEQEIRYSFC